MSNRKAIKSESEYAVALERTISIFHAEPGSLEFEELEQLLVLVKSYEDQYIKLAL